MYRQRAMFILKNIYSCEGHILTRSGADLTRLMCCTAGRCRFPRFVGRTRGFYRPPLSSMYFGSRSTLTRDLWIPQRVYNMTPDARSRAPMSRALFFAAGIVLPADPSTVKTPPACEITYHSSSIKDTHFGVRLSQTAEPARCRDRNGQIQ